VNPLLRWNIHDEEKLAEPPAEPKGGPEEADLEPSPEIWRRLLERVSWEYPFPGATRTAAKASVTALRRRAASLQDDDAAALRREPEDKTRTGGSRSVQARPGKPITTHRARKRTAAAEAGSAHHAFQQMVSLDRTDSVEQLKAEAERLVQLQA